ncbi:Uma2 family endonuclease [Leptolyngbya sp. AN02str]|uniref:Uma2 family endonuclease n=1 Tax=Leptolyngbya sp. AN02str TaxID=3423363 RepID=UPI003D31EFD6
MVQTPSKPISLEEFLKLPETKPASEFIDGKVIQKPMPQGQHSRIQQKLTARINAVTEDEHIALALPELRCTFGGRSIIPDIAVFTWDRIPSNPDGTIANQFNAQPDWTIEILSPDQSVMRVTSNILHCLSHGSQMGWLIDPNEKLVLVYASNQQPSFFEELGDRLPVPEFAATLALTLEQLFGWLQVR